MSDAIGPSDAFRAAMVKLNEALGPDPRDATIDHLATLLDGVLSDDPQAIRDASAWLTANRPID